MAIKGWLMRVAFSSHVFALATVKLESFRRLSGRLDVNRTVLSPPFHRSIRLQPKRAFSAVDPVFLAPTADSWAVRSGPPVSAARADSAGLSVSAQEERASAFLDLTFYFSFACLAVVGNW